MEREVIIIGAGVAGLQCARDLSRAGRLVRVLERAKGVGGRCATRHFEGQPIDFGPMFLHGQARPFLQALAEIPGATLTTTWPWQVEGQGQPCQPNAFDAAERRAALPAGVNAFPKHLAQGLDVRLHTTVTGLALEGDRLEVRTAEGERFTCSDLVLALALEETLELLEPLPELASIRALLGLFASVPSLTLLTAYPLDAPAPDWDLLYPEASEALQLVSQDSRKRDHPKHLTLVLQARPRWSRERMAQPLEAWSAELLQAAAAVMGDWVLRPLWTHPHRWRYARVDRGNELACPLLTHFQSGPRLGLAGDVFAPGGGVQAAWLSGSALAQRFLDEEQP